MPPDHADSQGGAHPWLSGRRRYAAATAGVAALLAVGIWTGVLTVPEGAPAAALSVLREFGLPALFGASILEGALLLYFAPSESLVPAGVVLLGTSPVDVLAVLAVTVAGATVGQTVLFLAAKRGGRELLAGRRWLGVSERRLDGLEAWFDRWGDMAVPVSNALPLVRGLATVPAGLAGMDTRRFVVLSALGTLAFEGVLAGLALAGRGLL
jgi:membrane protein DedA with SNARE-associated domain